MKIWLDQDERYPHYYFYPDEEGWVPDWFGKDDNHQKSVEVPDDIAKKMIEVRDAEYELQDQLEKYFESSL